MRAYEPGDPFSALIRSGDRERIARELYPLARGYVSSVLRQSDDDLIETATSETLLAVCRYHGTFRGKSSSKSWLYTIARREALRVRRCTPTFLSLEGQAAAAALDRMTTLPCASAASEAWIDLRTAIPRPEWRRIWLLANAPHPRRSVAEVARIVGYSEGSVSVILSHVRRRIRAYLHTGLAC